MYLNIRLWDDSLYKHEAVVEFSHRIISGILIHIKVSLQPLEFCVMIIKARILLFRFRSKERKRRNWRADNARELDT